MTRRRPPGEIPEEGLGASPRLDPAAMDRGEALTSALFPTPADWIAARSEIAGDGPEAKPRTPAPVYPFGLRNATPASDEAIRETLGPTSPS